MKHGWKSFFISKSFQSFQLASFFVHMAPERNNRQVPEINQQTKTPAILTIHIFTYIYSVCVFGRFNPIKWTMWVVSLLSPLSSCPCPGPPASLPHTRPASRWPGPSVGLPPWRSFGFEWEPSLCVSSRNRSHTGHASASGGRTPNTAQRCPGEKTREKKRCVWMQGVLQNTCRKYGNNNMANGLMLGRIVKD